MSQTHDTKGPSGGLVHPSEIERLLQSCTTHTGYPESDLATVHLPANIGRGDAALPLPQMVVDLNNESGVTYDTSRLRYSDVTSINDYRIRDSTVPKHYPRNAFVTGSGDPKGLILVHTESCCGQFGSGHPPHGDFFGVGTYGSNIPVPVVRLESGPVHTPGDYDVLVPHRPQNSHIVPNGHSQNEDTNLAVRTDNPTEHIYTTPPDTRFSSISSENSRGWTKKTCVSMCVALFVVMAIAIISLILTVCWMSATSKSTDIKTPATASQTLSDTEVSQPPIPSFVLEDPGSVTISENVTRHITTSTTSTSDSAGCPSTTAHAISTFPSTPKTDLCAHTSEVVCKLSRTNRNHTIKCTVSEQNAKLTYLAVNCLIKHKILRNITDYSRCCCCQTSIYDACWSNLTDAIYDS